MIAMLDPQLLAVLAVLFGGSGILAVSLKKNWSSGDSHVKVYLDATAAAKAEHKEELQRVRDEAAQDISRLDEKFEREIDELREHVEKLHVTIGKLLDMIKPEHMPEAVALIAELGLPGSRPRGANRRRVDMRDATPSTMEDPS